MTDSELRATLAPIRARVDDPLPVSPDMTRDAFERMLNAWGDRAALLRLVERQTMEVARLRATMHEVAAELEHMAEALEGDLPSDAGYVGDLQRKAAALRGGVYPDDADETPEGGPTA